MKLSISGTAHFRFRRSPSSTIAVAVHPDATTTELSGPTAQVDSSAASKDPAKA